jgi:hypothetical protein
MLDRLLETTGIELKDGGIPELMKFQEHFKVYRIVVYGGLNCKDIVFEGQVESEKGSTFFMTTSLVIIT